MGNVISKWNLWVCFVIFFVLGRDVGGETPSALSSLPLEGKARGDQKTSCDFEVVVSEPDFCVIQGRVHDVDVTLVPISGVCKGSATLSVSGLPKGVTSAILPFPKMRFKKGMATATVRIDTDGISYEKMATSTLTFTASKKAIVKKAKAEMTIDLPKFDFSMKARPKLLTLHQAESAEVEIDIQLLGSACRSVPNLDIRLDSTTSLPAMINHHFSSRSVKPPVKTTLSFEAEESPEGIGVYKAIVAGCCTGEQEEKKTEIVLNNVTLPSWMLVPPPFPGNEYPPDIVGKITGEPMERSFKLFDVPLELQEQTRKDIEDERTKGYMEVPESRVNALRDFKAQYGPLGHSTSLLTFDPASLENSSFQSLKLEGGLATSEVAGLFTRLARLFSMADGTLVSLEEWDYVSAGGGSVYIKETINEKVNGFPARLSILKSLSGRWLTTMTWATPAISYTLDMEGNIKENGRREFFLNLARSITKEQKRDRKTVKTPGSPMADDKGGVLDIR